MPEQDVILKTIEPQHVIAIREVVPLPESVGTLLGESFMALGPRGIAPVGAPLGIFYDEEFKPADLDVEIAIPVGPQVKESIPLDAGRQLATRTLPGLDHAACIIHTGSYDNLTATYTAIARWIEANGYRIAGPSREVYLTAPGDPAGQLTEIQYPVIKA
jgi:effector-binding domain-containing protein